MLELAASPQDAFERRACREVQAGNRLSVRPLRHLYETITRWGLMGKS
jgi:hypothetical protein